MRIALFGISCVGKTTVGQIMADALGYTFVDFDHAVIERFQTTLTALKKKCGSEYHFRLHVSPLLAQILDEYPDNLVLAMPPSGLFPEYKQVFDYHSDVVTVWLSDKAKYILKRLIFTDDNDQLIESPVVTKKNAWHYRDSIEDDILYYCGTLQQAQIKFKIKGRNATETAEALIEALQLNIDEIKSSN